MSALLKVKNLRVEIPTRRELLVIENQQAILVEFP